MDQRFCLFKRSILFIQVQNTLTLIMDFITSVAWQLGECKIITFFLKFQDSWNKRTGLHKFLIYQWFALDSFQCTTLGASPSTNSVWCLKLSQEAADSPLLNFKNPAISGKNWWFYIHPVVKQHLFWILSENFKRPICSSG